MPYKVIERSPERTKTTIVFGPHFGRMLSISWRNYTKKGK